MDIFGKFSRLREIVLTFVVNFSFSRLREECFSRLRETVFTFEGNCFHVCEKFSRLIVGKSFHVCGIFTFVGIFTFEGSTTDPFILTSTFSELFRMAKKARSAAQFCFNNFCSNQRCD